MNSPFPVIEFMIHFLKTAFQEIMFRTRNYVPNKKLCSEQEIIFRTRNYVPNKKLCSKQEILFQKRNFVPNKKFCSKQEIMFRTRIKFELLRKQIWIEKHLVVNIASFMFLNDEKIEHEEPVLNDEKIEHEEPVLKVYG